MTESARLRLLRVSVATECPWCSQPPGAECRDPVGQPLPVPHAQRLTAHLNRERAARLDQ